MVETEWQGPKGGVQIVETQRWVLLVEESEASVQPGGTAELTGTDAEVADRAWATFADLHGALADSLAAAAVDSAVGAVEDRLNEVAQRNLPSI